jgi:U4/U6.U5 tri-snRNP component SNU23
MSDKKSAYGGPKANDVSFRKTWDVADYADRAAQRESKERAEAKARYEAKMAGKKYVARASTPPELRESKARTERFDFSSMVGKTQLVSGAMATVGRKGKKAGIYCDACDLTCKDSREFLKHINSRQHQMNIGESGLVKKATVAEVRATLRYLKRKMDEEAQGATINLEERLQIAMEREDKEREEKRRKRREKRRKTKDGAGVQQEVFVDDGVIR